MVADLTEIAGDDVTKLSQLRHIVVPWLLREFGEFTQGQRFTKKEELMLRRTEAGWVLVN